MKLGKRPYFLLLALLTSMAGCGQLPFLPGAIPLDKTTCAKNSVQILVGDGYLQNLCGCVGTDENGTQYSATSGELTCELPTRDTVVFFHFLNTTLKHQILPLSSGDFPPSPPHDPTDLNPQKVYAVQPNRVGSIGFIDAFSGRTGQLLIY